MNYAEAIEFLYGLRLFGAKFGLENTFKLAALAGNPQEKLRFIHVAGTNGKGSTCAMLESIYRAAGLRTGLFTSPHLISFAERIQVNRQLISETDVARLVGEMKELLKDFAGKSSAGFQPAGSASIPARSSQAGGMDATTTSRQDACATFFEVVTVMALKYFAEQKCDIVVWETGMGGRLDATNIVQPLASVITNVQLDHQQWLGDTLEKIAFEKAGIIKPNTPIITAASEIKALHVIEQVAQEKKASALLVTQADTQKPPLDRIEIPLLGEHQRLNAALAVATVRTLQKQIPVSEEQISAGLRHVYWAGRLQMFQIRPRQTILIDGAHNAGGVETLRAALKKHFRHRKPAFILGILKDKDFSNMCKLLAPLARHIFLVPVKSERTAKPEELLEACRAENPIAFYTVCSSVADALRRAADQRFVVIAGSLYLIGEALEHLTDPGASQISERELNEWFVNPSDQEQK